MDLLNDLNQKKSKEPGLQTSSDSPRSLLGPAMILPLLFFGVLLAILLHRNALVGTPHVFPDETNYFNLIRLLAVEHRFDPSQYGILFPWLAHFFYDAANVVDSYLKIRILNQVLFSLAFFPLFFIGRNLFASNWIASLSAFAICLLPWSTLTFPLVAEPVFILFSCLTLWFIFEGYRTGGLHWFLLLGFSMGMTFLAKQASMFSASIFLACHGLFILFHFVKHRRLEWRSMIQGLLALAPLALTVLAYKMANAQSGGIGYGGTMGAMISKGFSLVFQADFYRSFMHQVGYATLATFCVFFAATLRMFFRIRSIPTWQGKFLVIAVIQLVAMFALIAVFNNTINLWSDGQNEPRMAFGRYLVALFPALFLLGVKELIEFRGEKGLPKYFQLFAIVTVLLTVTWIFSPFHSLHASLMYGNPDIAILSVFHQGMDFPPWDRQSGLTDLLSNSWLLVLSLFGCTMVILTLTIAKPKLIFTSLALVGTLSLALWSSNTNMGFVRAFSNLTLAEESVFRNLARKNTDPSDVFLLGDYLPHRWVAMFWPGFYDFDGWQVKNRIPSWPPAKSISLAKGKTEFYLISYNREVKGETPIFQDKLVRLYRIPLNK